jgi:uncharacterized protein YegP (UPF0339 family)
MPMRFDVYTHGERDERWKLVGDGGSIVATSVDSFATRAAADRAAEEFRGEAGICDYDVWDNDRRWYWDGNAANGRPIVTGASAGFSSEWLATRAYESVRDNAGRASGL